MRVAGPNEVTGLCLKRETSHRMGRSSAPGVPWTRLDEGKDAFDSLAVRKALIAPADANNRTAETMIYLTLMVDPR